jgi:zinc D-Ala-D-Ala carboxypeptidase
LWWTQHVPNLVEIHERLGIPPDYGRSPIRPHFVETRELVEVTVGCINRPVKLAPIAAQAWTAMFDAARSQHIGLLLVSGYRSVTYQRELFERKLASGQAINQILAVNAAPGFSEHHTGCALDIGTPGCESLTEDFEDTDAFRWLVSNAHSFAFSMSYPRGNRFGFIYEPWHWAHASIARTARQRPHQDPDR